MTEHIDATTRNDWALFTDWCAAYKLSALPADPLTVARFLDQEGGHRSKVTTKRRRATSINMVHRSHGWDSPGTGTAVRRLLATRQVHTEQRALAVIRQLPTTGWPAGLFGRRDALLLHLACTVRMPAAEISALRAGDIVATHSGVCINSRIKIVCDRQDPFGLFQVWKRWAKTHAILVRRHCSIDLVAPLTGADPVNPSTVLAPTPPPAPSRPNDALFPAFDRWGSLQNHPGHNDIGMAPRVIVNTISAHLTGQHKGPGTRDKWVQGLAERYTSEPEYTPPAAAAPVEFDDIHQHGVDAKRTALDDLAELDAKFAQIDAMTDDLLARTEKLLADLE